MEDGSYDPSIIVWHELSIPGDKPVEQWDAYFQPMIQAPGHAESVWAKIPERPDTVIVVTHWYYTASMKNFRDSPSAQLFWENLSAKGIRNIASYESEHIGNWFDSLLKSYVQLFRIYFQAPVTDEHRARISKLWGMEPAALGPSVPRKDYIQRQYPCRVWTTRTEEIQGKNTQLMLLPHFWMNPEKAKWRHTSTFILLGSVAIGKQTIQEKFIGNLNKVGPIEWREEFYNFTKIPDINI